MWTVKLLGENTYRSAANRTIALSALPATGWIAVPILGANTSLEVATEVVSYGRHRVRSQLQRVQRRIELRTADYAFPTRDDERRQLEEYLTSYDYLWLDWNDYPGRTCPAYEAVAVELERIEVEHDYRLGRKWVTITLYETER